MRKQSQEQKARLQVLNREVGARIGRLIDEHDTTQSRLAKAIGISEGQLSRAIKGERGLSDHQLAAAAAEFGVAIDDLRPAEESARPVSDFSQMTVASARLTESRRAFLDRHREQLAPAEIRFLETVRFSVEADPTFAPGDDFWWSVTEAYRRREAARRRGGSGSEPGSSL
jgi:transcriptional regulator with XRE-family HTH domain